MKYGSVCSGVEAATVAWHPLGWEPQWFSEIEKFPSAVLAHHYPDVPNFGDMTAFKGWPNDRSIDLLVGGTPCQSFSVAGLRKGLDDPRGNLMLTYLAIAAQYRPKWLVWENVPGVLSSNRGRDFGSFLGALGQCGYGFAYRTLDAQFYGVPQRRRRVFVVGYLGDWRRAAAVLFERHSLQGHPAPSRQAREETAGTVTTRAGSGGGGGLGTDEACSGYLQPTWPAEIASTLNAAFGDKQGLEDQHINSGAPLFVPDNVGSLTAEMHKGPRGTEAVESNHVIAFGAAPLNTQLGLRGPHTSNSPREGLGVGNIGDPAYTIQAAHSHGVIAFGAQNSAAQGDSVSTDVTPTLDKSKTPAVAIGIDHDHNAAVELMGPLIQGPQGSPRNAVMQASAVRRLTPKECERLQGFPDNYTQIPWRNKPAESCPDGPRYKAMGNSMAVPVMRWIGERISMVEAL
tara:strand:+ start:441 stop:1811 length:1371 start_codon:yes stop_codon:yes gene_type:complete